MTLLGVPGGMLVLRQVERANHPSSMRYEMAGIPFFLICAAIGLFAGVVAGLLYAFSPIRVGFNITHPSVWDSGWLVFALFFSHRLFAHGRWRVALG